MTIDYALNELSYANMIMYGSVMPSYNSDKDGDNETINADDPTNKDKVRSILFED